MTDSIVTPAHDKPLFTPGPLTTSATVKQAMLRDLGSRDGAFIAVVQSIRDGLLRLACTDASRYAAIPLQGSGTYALEAVVASLISADGKLLVLVNGAYGRRLATIAERLGVAVASVRWREDEPVDPDAAARVLQDDPAITHVSACHCETTSGVMNPVGAIGRVVRDAGRRFFVDAMSSFGAVPMDVESDAIDYLVSSANKCIEGVPGFSFVLSRLDDLLAGAGRSRSTCLDLTAQYKGLEGNGQFRFTPPTHAMLAFHQALRELEAEGGVAGRGERYRRNHEMLTRGMARMGFEAYVPEVHQSYIITTYLYPKDPAFAFEDFYDRLNGHGYVIYPGKVTEADCFRIGTIGRLFPGDVLALLSAIADVLEDMGIGLPLNQE